MAMQITLTPSCQRFPVDTPVQLELGVRLGAPPAGSRPPLHLALVLDRSESMSTKLAHALAFARLVIERLRPRDYLTLILVADLAEVVASGSGADRVVLGQALEAVRIGTATNLSAGWLRAVEVLRAARTPISHNRILLLSDGEPTRGVTDCEVLCRAAADLSEEGITTSAVWYAASDCPDEAADPLLPALARMGRGALARVPHPYGDSALPVTEVAGVPPLVAQNVRLILHPSRALQEVSCEGGIVGQRHGDGLEIHVGDLAGEQEWSGRFLLAGRPGLLPGTHPLATLEVHADGVLGRIEHHAERREVAVEVITEVGKRGDEKRAEPGAGA